MAGAGLRLKCVDLMRLEPISPFDETGCTALIDNRGHESIFSRAFVPDWKASVKSPKYNSDAASLSELIRLRGNGGIGYGSVMRKGEISLTISVTYQICSLLRRPKSSKWIV